MENMDTNQPVILKDDITYSPDSIVSKTLLENDGGTITLFAFDQGQNLSEHTAPFDAEVIVLEGKADVFIAGKINVVPEGGMILMPADIPHAVKASEKFKMLLIMIQK